MERPDFWSTGATWAQACAYQRKRACFLKHAGRTVYRLFKDDGPLQYWYSTSREALAAEGRMDDALRAHQFDVRELPAEFLDGLNLEIDVDAAMSEGGGFVGPGWGKEFARVNADIATAIRRAIDASHPLSAGVSGETTAGGHP